MKRLTIRNSDGTVSQPMDTHWADVFERLAEYEDTGLTPEECAEYRKFEDEAVSKGVPFSRIVELMDAEAEDRLIVLPCKPGDTVQGENMSDLIRREDALACFHDWLDEYWHEHTADEMTEYAAIEAPPSVDAVEVVRCRDCKFYNNHGLKDACYDEDACHWSEVEQPNPDDYCSGGERRGGR